jgi:hypothetical protein
MNTVCSNEQHAAMKTDDAIWYSLEPIGMQEIEAFEDEPAEVLEMRNCACGSTLCRTYVVK